jgi:hypothetical protein
MIIGWHGVTSELGTMCDATEALDRLCDRTGLGAGWELLDSRFLEHRSPMSHIPFHLFALEVYAN